MCRGTRGAAALPFPALTAAKAATQYAPLPPMSSTAPIHSESRAAASSRSWLCALAMMLLVFSLSNSDLVLARSVPIWDGDSLYGPYQMLVADHARAGQLLLWNPWTLGGAPDSAEPQAGAFSPVAVLIGAIAGGTLSGFCAYWLFVWLLGGTGMMMLARHLRAPAWGGFIVTMAFLFSGLYMGHASHTSYLSSFAYLPWFLWRLDVAMTEHRLWPAAEAGALWGLSALSGYPAMTILTPCYGAAWALGRTWLSQSPEDGKKKAVLLKTSLPRQTWFLVLALAVVCVVGVLVLAPPYVGLLTEAVGVTERIGERPRVIAIGQSALHPGALLTFASPYLSSLKLWNPTLWPYRHHPRERSPRLGGPRPRSPRTRATTSRRVALVDRRACDIGHRARTRPGSSVSGLAL